MAYFRSLLKGKGRDTFITTTVDPLSYTGKDIVAIREEVMNHIKEVDPNWTDYNESSLQLQYVDILSGVADMLCYYLDNQALEVYLSTARQEKNIRAIMKTFGYDMPYMGAAQGSIKLSRKEQEIGSYDMEEVVIPKYTSIYSSTDSTVPRYLTMEEAVLDDKTKEITVNMIQGELRQVAVPIDSIRNSYRVYLTDKPVPLEYVEIVNKEDGTQWEKVRDAFLEIKGGPKYSPHVDSKGRVYILFTCNWKDFLDEEANAVMTFQYIETLGRAGIVPEYSLDTLGPGPYLEETKEDAQNYLLAENPDVTYGAFDKPDLNKQKANAMNWIQTYDRLITLKDFDTMLRQNPWVVDCYVADWRTNNKLVKYPHEAYAWIVPIDGNISVLNNKYKELEESIQSRSVLMTSVQVKPAEFRVLNWVFKLHVSGISNTEKEKLRYGVENMLKERYTLSSYCSGNKNSLLKFNMEVRTSTLLAAIYNYSDAITKIELPIEEDFRLAENEFLDVKTLRVEIVE